MSVEPIVLEQIIVRQRTLQYVPVTEDLEQIRRAAEWARSFGDTEVRDVGPDGFRYRTVSASNVGHWAWIEPGMWLARYEHEFDLPHDDPWPYDEGWEQKSGPPRPPKYGWDEDDCEGADE